MASGYKSSSSMADNKYWITGKDIHKKIITSMLQDFLGPDATVRSYTNNGEDGFLISTPGDCLTDEQIDEICKQSKQMWERQAAERRPSLGGPTAGLRRPLHKPIIISRARSRSSSSTTTGSQNRRAHGHRASLHSPPLQSPQQRARHLYTHSGAGQQYALPPPQQQQQPPATHHAQPYPSYPAYDAPRDAGDGRFSPYPPSPSSHAPSQHARRRVQRSFSGSSALSHSEGDYSYQSPPWGELPAPIGPPSAAPAARSSE